MGSTTPPLISSPSVHPPPPPTPPIIPSPSTHPPPPTSTDSEATAPHLISSPSAPTPTPLSHESVVTTHIDPTHSSTTSPPSLHESTIPTSSPANSTDPNPSSPILPAPTRHSTRTHTLPSWHKDYHMSNTTFTQVPLSDSTPTPVKGTKYPLSNFVSYSRLSLPHRVFLATVSGHSEPTSYSQAAADPNWQQAMTAELNALQQNHTWTLVPLPAGHKPIGCKWVYRIKYHSDGTIERYKARLVAKGYTQVEGVDYIETFSSTAKLTTLRCILAVAASRNWHIHQLDVQNAFLHGDLHEEVYMDPPPGLRRQGEHLVCRLNKSLYGLKQASRNWFSKFSSAIQQAGFQQSKADYSLFTKTCGSSFTVVLIYVDDILLTGNNLQEMEHLKSVLLKKFRIKDLGNLKYFLGLEFSRSKKGIFVSQRKYSLDILQDAGLSGAKPETFPMEQHLKLTPDDGELLHDPTHYKRMVGRLIYLTVTRPDIVYSVQTLSQYMHQPRKPHLQAALRVLRYIKGSPGQGLLFPAANDLSLKAYCDSDWAGCKATRKSVTGFCVFMGDALISWKSKKQSNVSRSSAKAEYRAMATTCLELTWLQYILRDLKVLQDKPIALYCGQ